MLNNPIGSPFIELQSVDSSNNYAMALVHAQLAQHGAAYFAHEQTSGKGQRGKTWKAEKGANIIISITLRPGALIPAQQFHLSACIAVAVRTFFSSLAGEETTIKWPNDIYWRDRKAAGILIENVIGPAGRDQGMSDPDQIITPWLWAVIGIGININQISFSADLPNPVSLKQITGNNYDVVVLSKELCKCIDTYYRLLRGEGFDELLKSYNQYLYKKNELVKLRKDNRVFEATIRRVDRMGRLIVSHAIEESLEFGSVEWVL